MKRDMFTLIVLGLVIPCRTDLSSTEEIDILTEAIKRYVDLDGGCRFISLRHKDDTTWVV